MRKIKPTDYLIEFYDPEECKEVEYYYDMKLFTLDQVLQLIKPEYKNVRIYEAAKILNDWCCVGKRYTYTNHLRLKEF